MKLGNVFGFFIGRRPILVIADPELLRQILAKDFGNFLNRLDVAPARHPLPLSVHVAKNDDWKRVRKRLNSIFTSGTLKSTTSLIEECLERLLENLRGTSEEDKSIEIWSVYGKFTLDVIMSTAFGKRIDVQYGVKNTTIEQHLYNFFKGTHISQCLDVLDPPKWLRTLFSRFIFSEDPTYFVNLLKPILEERKKANVRTRCNFLDFMLNEDGTGSEKSGLTDDEIMAQALTFLLAGYDTTANALSYVTYLLALHPDIQEKLYKEVKVKFQDDTFLNLQMYEKMQTLNYLDQVLSEALRMFPPAYFVFRNAKKDFYMNGACLPSSVEIMVPIYAIHHNPEFWNSPDTFDPERFSSDLKSDRHPCIYLPFGVWSKALHWDEICTSRIENSPCKYCLKVQVREVPGDKSSITTEFRANTFSKRRHSH